CLFPKKFIDELIEDGNILTGCQMTRGRGIILGHKGNLIPCNHLCHLSLGNLTDDFSNREEYIQFRKRDEVRDFYRDVSLCPHKNCVDCAYWSMCGAGCKLYWLRYNANDLIGDFKGGD
ncbi:MAG: SPASM domain-containing protein, partial [Candidatus Portnoybacteria bacterium]|nr:SPASM domain-containing protein [Candidatus Portnoybacteria bacterium]